MSLRSNISFGLQVYDDDTAEKLTTLALEAGIRNYFSSVLAGNQQVWRHKQFYNMPYVYVHVYGYFYVYGLHGYVYGYGYGYVCLCVGV